MNSSTRCYIKTYCIYLKQNYSLVHLFYSRIWFIYYICTRDGSWSSPETWHRSSSSSYLISETYGETYGPFPPSFPPPLPAPSFELRMNFGRVIINAIYISNPSLFAHEMSNKKRMCRGKFENCTSRRWNQLLPLRRISGRRVRYGLRDRVKNALKSQLSYSLSKFLAAKFRSRSGVTAELSLKVVVWLFARAEWIFSLRIVDWYFQSKLKSKPDILRCLIRNKFTLIDWTFHSYGFIPRLNWMLHPCDCERRYFHYCVELIFTRFEWDLFRWDLESKFR